MNYFGKHPEWCPRQNKLSHGLVLLLLGIAAVAMSPFANASSDRDQHKLESRIEQAIRDEQLVGAVWALVRPEETVLGAAGKSNATLGTPMTSAHQVHVGSLAKTLVALGILRLATEGRVEIDAPVGRYLQDVPVQNPWENESPLTVRHLLDHTGGLSDARISQVFSATAEPDQPLQQSLRLSDSPVRVRYRPGERAAYSNVGYVLLAMVIERVAGKRYEAWLGEEILSPLGMRESTFFFVSQGQHGEGGGLAMGHVDPRTPSPSIPMHLRSSGQFTSTASDMARLARFLMSDGRVNGRVLIDHKHLQQMGAPSLSESARAGLRTGYALGLMRRDRHGVVGKCHLGNLGTFRSALCVYPDYSRAFFVAYNSDPEGADFDRIDGMLVDALALPDVTKAPTEIASASYERWAGLYRMNPNRFEQFDYLDHVFGVTSVSRKDGALHLSPLQGSVRILRPIDGALLRAEDRVEASHVLIDSPRSQFAISDGIRTLEVASPLSVYGHWLSAAAGIVGFFYVLFAGGKRSLNALSRGAWLREPMSLPALGTLLVVLAPALHLLQPGFAFGDFSLASLAVAISSGFVPLALTLGTVMQLRSGLASPAERWDVFFLFLAIQWCVVLMVWRMMPFVSWM